MQDPWIGVAVGSFVITRRIGEGGMSRVYLAEHPVLRTRRAVKLLAPHLHQHELTVRRFVNEARAAAQLHHRNLIHVHDLGQLASGAWYMVLDYLEGVTLAREIAMCAGPMPPQRIVQIVCEIASGLMAAHARGIVHRDLKPENVLLAREGDAAPRAVVLDFGVAQHGDEREATPGTPRGIAVGTPAYMAPEQLRGGRVTAAVDVYALAVIAYRLTTGGWFPYQDAEVRAGYAQMSASELYHRQMSRRPADPRDRGARVGASWAAAIFEALDVDPEVRPPSAQAFAHRLAAAAPPPETEGGATRVGIAAVDEAPSVRLISARYRLGPLLGVGGMAEVWLAATVGVEGFERPVAIKRVLGGLSQIPAFAAMFVAEAKLAARLSHPNIVAVHDFSRDAAERLLLVMEYVDGPDLASLLAGGAIAPRVAVFLAIEVLRALSYAHELPDPDSGVRGVVHRDVSPQNVLLSYEGAVKLSDFGLAKVRAASGGAWSATVRGKPRYMSPEQIAGECIDARSDLYAVGVMLWEMLAGRPLYAGTAKEILAQVMFREAPRARAVRPSVPEDVEDVARKLLARDRRDRYTTAAEAIEALLACADLALDGRGELARLVATRFPRGGDPAIAPVAALRADVPTAPGPPLALADVAERAAGPRAARPARLAHRVRRTAMLAGLLLGLVAALVVVAGGEVAASRAARPAQAGDRTAPLSVTGRWGRVELSPTVRSLPAAGAGAATTPRAPEPDQRSRAVRAAPPARSRPIRTGELAIVVRPWAMVWLNGRPRGQTPFREAVPAGRYRIQLRNDDAGVDETTTVVVEPDRTATVERAW